MTPTGKGKGFKQMKMEMIGISDRHRLLMTESGKVVPVGCGLPECEQWQEQGEGVE